MNRINLGNKSFYVVSNDLSPMWYKVTSFDTFESDDIFLINLELVAVQGCDGIFDKNYVSEDFHQDVATWLFKEESMEEALKEEGYSIMDTNNAYDDIVMDFILQNA